MTLYYPRAATHTQGVTGFAVGLGVAGFEPGTAAMAAMQSGALPLSHLNSTESTNLPTELPMNTYE
jgi:hypothetical protein